MEHSRSRTFKVKLVTSGVVTKVGDLYWSPFWMLNREDEIDDASKSSIYAEHNDLATVSGPETWPSDPGPKTCQRWLKTSKTIIMPSGTIKNNDSNAKGGLSKGQKSNDNNVVNTLCQMWQCHRWPCACRMRTPPYYQHCYSYCYYYYHYQTTRINKQAPKTPGPAFSHWWMLHQ